MNVNKKICLLPFMFLSIVLYAKSYSIFYLNNLCGVIDENRKIIVEPKYEDIRITKISGEFLLEGIVYKNI